jgi:FkbM family methyltransferase
MTRKVKIGNVCFNVPLIDDAMPNNWDSIIKNYEPKTFKIFENLLSDKDVVLEVGIDASQTTFITALLAGKLIAIEPWSRSISYAKSILAVNPNLKNKIILVHGALSNTNEDVIFGPNQKLFDDIHFDSHSVPTIVKGFTIEMLEQLAQAKITFINMDIEGGEYIVLPAMKNWLRERKPTLLLSLHPGFLLSIKQQNRIKLLRYIRRFIEQIKIYKSIKFYEYIYDVENGKKISSLGVFKLKFVRSKSGQYSQILCLSYKPKGIGSFYGAKVLDFQNQQ